MRPLRQRIAAFAVASSIVTPGCRPPIAATAMLTGRSLFRAIGTRYAVVS
jgi:hypothetical protein